MQRPKEVILRKLTDKEYERIEELKKLFGVNTYSKAIKKLIREGKL